MTDDGRQTTRWVASGNRGDGEGVCLRRPRCSKVAAARLGTSGREGSGYSPVAAMAGATILARGIPRPGNPVIVETDICPGTHHLGATAWCCFNLSGGPGWILSRARDWRQHRLNGAMSEMEMGCACRNRRMLSSITNIMRCIGCSYMWPPTRCMCRTYPMAVICSLSRGHAKVNSSTWTDIQFIVGVEVGRV